MYKMTDRESDSEKGRGEKRTQDGESEVSERRVIGKRDRIMRKSAPFMDSYGSVLGGERDREKKKQPT